MAEIDTHWREFVHSLEGLSARIQGPQDLEQVLLGIHTLLHDAVKHAQKNGPQLSAQVRSSLRRDCKMKSNNTGKSHRANARRVDKGESVSVMECVFFFMFYSVQLAPCQIGMW